MNFKKLVSKVLSDAQKLLKKSVAIFSRFYKSGNFLKLIKKYKIIVSIISIFVLILLMTSFVVLNINDVKVFKDGIEIASFSTLNDDEASILSQSGVDFKGTDKITFNRSNTQISVNIKSSVNVKLTCDGLTKDITFAGYYINDLLKENKIDIGKDDILNFDVNGLVYEGLNLEIKRVGYSNVTETEKISYKTQKIKTSSLYLGESKIATKGKDGEKEVVYKVKYIDGKAVEKKAVSTKVITEPQNEVINVGTKVKKVSIASFSSSKVRPTSYKKVITMNASAYTYGDDGGNRTATGIRPYHGIVAVDPSVIPLGSKLYIETSDGSYIYGTAVAADVGGAIKGNRIDLFMESSSMCYSFGRRTVKVYIL